MVLLISVNLMLTLSQWVDVEKIEWLFHLLFIGIIIYLANGKVFEKKQHIIITFIFS